MKRNQRLLLAVSIAAVALLAVPALAQAAVWKDGSTNVTKFVELGLTGGELFEVPEGEAAYGMSCEIHATLTTEGGSTGKITKYETKGCPTGFGKMSGCTLASSESRGLPWSVTVNTTTLTIKNMHTKRTFGSGCAVTELDKTIAEVKVNLNTPSAITEMEWLGSITGYKIASSFKVDAPNSGTYGIG